MRTASPILGELIVPPNDTWPKIVVDAVACTALFAIATSLSGMIMYIITPFVDSRMAIIYLPVWSSCMLGVAFYARWRKRLRFTVADLAWAIPVLIAVSISLDLLGHSSFWSPLLRM